MPIAARIVLVAAALAASLMLVDWQREEERCTDDTKQLFFVLRDKAPAAQIDETLRSAIDNCQGGSRLVGPAVILFNNGERRRAELLIREVLEREPDSFSPWAGLAVIVRRSDPAESRRAAERARELNPLYRPGS